MAYGTEASGQQEAFLLGTSMICQIDTVAAYGYSCIYSFESGRILDQDGKFSYVRGELNDSHRSEFI